MRHLPLTIRLALAYVLVAALPLIGLAKFYLYAFETSLTRTVLQNISSIANKKASQIDTYINERLMDARHLRHKESVQRALEESAQAYRQGGLAAVASINERHRTTLQGLIDMSQYYDLLLIDADGNVVFSLLRETDLGSNLNTGPYQQTSLARSFRQAMASLHTDLTPFEPYAPSQNKHTAFLLVPLFDGKRTQGAIALQLNLDTLKPVVADRTGLGLSGETILAQRTPDGMVYTMPLKRQADAPFKFGLPLDRAPKAMVNALAGRHASGITRDYAGEEVAAAWRYLPALHWGMVVKIDTQEALAPVHQARSVVLVALGLFFLLSTAGGLLLGRRFVRSESLIAAQEFRYRAMFGSMNDGVALYRPTTEETDFVFVDFNRAAERITGVTREQVMNRRVTEVFPGIVSGGIFAAFQRVARGGEPETVALTNYQDERLSLWVENDVMRLPGGEILSVFKDITTRKQAEQGRELYANIFAHSGEAIMVTNRDNRIVEINPAFTRLTGYSLTEVRDQDPKILSSGMTSSETIRSLWACLQTASFWQGELWDRHKNGTVYPKWASISAIRDTSGQATHYIASFTDISERKAAEERIAHLAHHDILTGLFNRYNLESRLSQALLTAHRAAHQVAVMFIDLDRFKVINDTLGHHIGDQLLIEVAQRLRLCVRESDIVARLGGDEFVVVLTNIVAATDAAPVASKILDSICQPYRSDSHLLHTSPSIGISLYPQDGDTVETLMQNADTAMYHAKEQGRSNFQYFTAAMNASARERMELERDLRVAVDQGQFVAHYQPQIDTASGHLCGVEALVRWQHPQRGLVPPLKFIPIAEETGLIEAIGAWMLDESCRQLAVWRAANLHGFRIAVNLSAHQLRNPLLVDLVRTALAQHSLGEGDLELEVTESVAMSNPERAIAQLQALRALGVHLAIDDFGTGYSSLVYLKRLPIQVLKLDREFVRDIETDINDAQISTATLALAHGLGLKVVAEGVETPAQQAFLTAHGCDILQGYGIGRPMPGADLPIWLEQHIMSQRTTE